MSTVQEIKQAAAKLTREERLELSRWLADVAAEHIEREQWNERWAGLVAGSNAAVGPITWTREELYER